MEVSVADERGDRLSELPQSLILHILSFLPMRDVVSTNLLSKRWKNLWTTIPCLNFCDIIREGNRAERVRNFVNRALIFWKGNNILKFEIDPRCRVDMSLGRDVDLWVLFAVGNNVQELTIESFYPEQEEWEDVSSKNDVYTAPLCLNSCSSLRKLSLVGCNLGIRGQPNWNRLKSLRIHGFCLSECLISRILLGSPQLEEFDLRLLDSFGDLNIRSPSLKKLKFEKYLYFEDDMPAVDTVLRIFCPDLETLELTGIFYRKCLFANVSSLVDLTIGFDDPRYHDSNDSNGNELLGETLASIFPSIQHVEKVTLSVWCIQVLNASKNEYLLSVPLRNVKILKLDIDCIEVGVTDMMNTLGIFPNIMKLVIDDQTFPFARKLPEFSGEKNCFEFETNLSFPLQLKTIEIVSPFSRNPIFGIIELLLKHSSMLEKLVIRAEVGMLHSHGHVFSLKIAEILLSLPRSSPTAKVIFNTN